MIKTRLVPYAGGGGQMKIAMTEAAVKKLTEDSKKNETHRVIITSFGWGGPVFGLVPGELQTNDYLEEYMGIKIVVEQSLIEKFEGYRIDYSNFWLTRGFYIQAMRYGSRC